jgi:hypothetical protein
MMMWLMINRAEVFSLNALWKNKIAVLLGIIYCQRIAAF